MRKVLHIVGGFAPILTFVALASFFWVTCPSFRSSENFFNILRQYSPLAIMATGVTFVLLCAEIDLSIAAMATFSGVFCAFFYRYLIDGHPHMAPFLLEAIPILLTLLVVTALGYVSGNGAARVGVPSFMMTLAMQLILLGGALRITQGQPIFVQPKVLHTLANGNLFKHIPNITVCATVVLFLGFITLRYTRFGRYVYMVGGNKTAAELAGVNVKGITATCLAICGLTAGLAGLIQIGRMGSAQASGLGDMLIYCIAAVVLGGTSLFGGKGGIGSTVIGVLTLGVLLNGLNHTEVNVYLKEFISGVILLCALTLNVLMAKMKKAE